MNNELEHMARRVAADPFFLACPLATYARSEGLDDAALAARLGCGVADLTRLRLCRAPRPGADFRPDVTAVAAAFGVDPSVLANVVRLADGLTHLREPAGAAGRPGFMLAARDDDRDPPPEPATPEPPP